jgi:hypothetical protein
MIDLLFFSSPIGLGHATRDIAISQHISDISKRFVSGGSATELLSKYGFEAEDLYRPRHSKLNTASYKILSNGFSNIIHIIMNVKQFPPK